MDFDMNTVEPAHIGAIDIRTGNWSAFWDFSGLRQTFGYVTNASEPSECQDLEAL